MIAAIYARKSTEQNTSDEEKSVARQATLARAFAERNGWTVDGHVFADDGISGAEFLKRAGLNALLAAVRQRPCPFQVLVTMEVSRLGREQTETAVIIREILRAGVRLFTYSDGREITLESAFDKFALNALNFVAEMERELSRTRTREAMRSKASRGHVAAGKRYGYRNREILGPGGRRDHVEQDIVPEEAAVIRRMFAEAAQGRGFSRIAKGLNADGVPSPARGRGWATSGVRELLLRDLYRGRLIYGKTRWVDKGGTKVKEDCPESEWLIVESPTLRIVPEDLWRAAYARLERTRAEYKRMTGGKLVGRPASATRMPYLLSTLLECQECRGPMHATKRTGPRAEPRFYYVCTAHRVRGNTICTNAMAAHMPRLDEAFVAALERKVFTPDLVADVVECAVARRQQTREARVTQRGQFEAELKRLEAELRRYAEAIATAGPLPALLDAVRTRERRRQDLQAHLEHLNGLDVGRRADRLASDLRATVSQRLADWLGLFKRHSEDARESVLRPLLAHRIVMTPLVKPEGRFYDFEAELSYGALIRGLIGVADARVMTVVPPG